MSREARFQLLPRYAASAGIVLATTLIASSAAAQALNYAPNVGGYGQARTVAGQILSRPTVSPYLELAFRGPAASNGFGSFIATYQGIVRPQMEIRQEREAAQLQMRQLQQQVAQIRSEFQQNQQQNGQFATGHVTRYRVHSHYYPRLDQPRQ